MEGLAIFFVFAVLGILALISSRLSMLTRQVARIADALEVANRLKKGD